MVDASVDEVSDLVDEAVVEGACEEKELGLVELVDVFVRLVLVDDFVLVDEEEEDAACGCTSSLNIPKITITSTHLFIGVPLTWSVTV